MPESLKGEQMAKPKRGSLTDAMDRMERARAATNAAVDEVEPAISKPTLDPYSGEVQTPKKVKISLYLDRSLVEQARGAVAWAVMQGGEPESISAMMNAALAVELDRLKSVLKPDGGQFPNLARGRKGRPPRA